MKPLNRRTITLAGIFLVVVGSIFLILGIWYAQVYGISVEIPDESGFWMHGGVFSLIVTSCLLIVIGAIFLLWAYKLPKQQS